MHARGDMITGVLKQQYGFDGFVISDWQGINQIGPDYETDVKVGVNAGIDMVMVPDQYVNFEHDLTDLVSNGGVTEARIDDAVSRILTQKFKLGLFEQPYTDRTNASTIGDAAHRAVAREAAAESQVLLKNAGALPLSTSANIYVAGSNADDLGNQTGGWTVTWQGASGSHDVGTTIFQGMQADAPNAHFTFSADASAPMTGSDVGVVVVGETPYAEGVGDIGNGHTDDLSTADKMAVDKVCGAMKCVVLVVSGRPMNIASIQGEANAIVASWLPGTEGEGVADTLFGLKPFTGRLPETWAKLVDTTTTPLNVGDTNYDPLYPYGWGLRTDSAKTRVTTVRDSLATQHGIVAKIGAQSLTALLAPGPLEQGRLGAQSHLGVRPARAGEPRCERHLDERRGEREPARVCGARHRAGRGSRERRQRDVEDGGAHGQRRARPACRQPDAGALGAIAGLAGCAAASLGHRAARQPTLLKRGHRHLHLEVLRRRTEFASVPRAPEAEERTTRSLDRQP